MTTNTQYGRATDDGTVFVKTTAGETQIGQYTIGTPEEALAFYVNKYESLVAEVNLALSRLQAGKGSPEGALELAAKLDAQVATPSVVGDLSAFPSMAAKLRELGEVKAAEKAAAKAAAREAALVKRTAIADEAEQLANSNAWKATQERFAVLLEEWKKLPRGERETEQVQWKRFSAARQSFDKARRTHFAELTKATAASKAIKNEIIAEATELAKSTDWNVTSNKFKALMDRWRNAPRGNKKDDDALWNKFRSLQQEFFDARSAALSVRDEALGGNLKLKLDLLVEAEAILPVTDLAAAKKAFKSVLDRWTKIGHVPRADIQTVEGRLRKVENAIKEIEQEEWRKNDPSRKAFAATTASKFQDSVDQIQAALDKAKASGSKDVAKLEAQLVNAKAMLEAAMKHA
ncbi:MAG: hypothetical protein RL228_1463 [Actinomycetota bacterium]